MPRTLQSHLCLKIDGLINTYLFDIEYYSTTQSAESAEQLSESESLIRNGLQTLKKEDLEFLFEKYNAQNNDLLEEIDWRRRSGKTQDYVKEEIQKELSHILKFMQGCIAKAPRATVLQRTPTPQQEISIQEPKKTLEEIATEQGYTLFTPTESEPSKPMYNEVQTIPQENSTYTEQNISIEKQKEKNIVEKESRPVKQKAIKKTKKSASIKKGTPSSRHIPEKKTIDETVWEELEIPKKTSKESVDPETKIEQMISEYLEKYRKKDWRERDREEKLKRKKCFEEELRMKELRKQREKKKKAGSRGKKSSDSSSSKKPPQSTTWWDMFRKK
ncbi:MAG TPA: hypothetical protein PKM32_02705 [Planctomycetota bacterium]|nr:hypothetical protein [Planctomycetota bacterium]